MYQAIPLLFLVAVLMPWMGPADPGSRIAAANAADGLAQQVLIYHQAALAAVRASPGLNAEVPVGTLPDRWTAADVVACVKAGLVATYVAVPSTMSAPAVATAIGRLWGGYALVGQASAGAIFNPMTGETLALPCAVPSQAPVIVSQVGG